jgi:hypothetical protein
MDGIDFAKLAVKNKVSDVRCLDLHSTFNLDVIFCMKMSEMTSDVIDCLPR